MILITGAAGQLGRRVAAAIAKRHAAAGVTLGTRTPEKIAALAGQGFNVVTVDFDRPQSLQNVFAGAATVLLISTDTLDSAARIAQHSSAVDAAMRAGVKRIVYTSFVNATPSTHFPAARVHAATESYIKASGMSYTLFRVNQYFENLNGSLAQAKATGSLVLPGAHGKVAYIARQDVADALAGSLLNMGGANDIHANRTYNLTGPQSLDLYEVGAALSAAVGKPIHTVDAAPAEFGKQLSTAGIPGSIIEQLLGICAASAAGEYSAVTADTARLAGRALTTAADYLKKFA